MTWRGDIVDGPLDLAVLGPAVEVPGPFGGTRLSCPRIGTVEGYHLNLARPSLDEASAPFEVDPQAARRTWAGDSLDTGGRYVSTACLTFADEAEARATLPADWWREGAAPPP